MNGRWCKYCRPFIFFALMAVFSGLMIVVNTVYVLKLLIFNRVGGFLSSENSIFLLI